MLKLTFLIFGIILLLGYGETKGQTMLPASFDHDQVIDSIAYNTDQGVVTVKLSTQDFRAVHSQSIRERILKWATDNQLEITENGFRIAVDFLGAQMLTRNNYYFEYDEISHQFMLVRLTSAINGSGNSVEASLELPTGLFKANWTRYSYQRKAQEYHRRQLPTVTDTINLPGIRLNEFDGAVFKTFEMAINESFEKANTRHKN